MTSSMLWQASGVIVKVWSDPQLTGTPPDGETLPPTPVETRTL